LGRDNKRRRRDLGGLLPLAEKRGIGSLRPTSPGEGCNATTPPLRRLASSVPWTKLASGR
jgi:hypothetical protein